jgi:putative hydrolase of the HAD superfamily
VAVTIETLFLDAGGVLVEPNWTRVAAVMSRHGFDVDPAQLAAAEPRAKREMDVAQVIQATHDASRAWLYYELVLRYAGAPVPAELAARASADITATHAESNLWETVVPGVPGALDRLSRLMPLVVVSNANGTVQSLFDRLDLSRYFTHIVDSTVVGVEKPDPAIFRIALDRAGARAETTLHVGDLYHVDVMGARAAGLQAWLLDPAGLYPDADCPRVPTLAALADRLATVSP